MKLLLRILGVLIALLFAQSSHATSIRLVELCGLYDSPCGLVPFYTLEQNGPALDYLIDQEGDVLFSLAYIDDDFVMTALKDNEANQQGLSRLAIFPGTGPIVVPIDPPCVPEPGFPCATPTQIGSVAYYQFPDTKGEQFIVALPPAVPEPGTWALMGAGLLAAWGWRRRLAV